MDKLDTKALQDRIFELEAQVDSLKSTNTKLKAVVDEYKNKEQSISSAIISSMEHANQLEASRKKLYLLDIQRSRLMYLKMEQIINELYRKYPELRKDEKLKDMSEKFKTMLFHDINEKSQDNILQDMKKQSKTDDPIKKLLRNIVDSFDSKKVEEDVDIKKAEPIKQTEPSVGLDRFIQGVTPPPPSSSGFDFNEALHPTMELDEIMKAFNIERTDEDKN